MEGTMPEVVNGIVVSVCSAIILAAIGGLWVVFSKRGRTFWSKLSTFELGPLSPTRTLTVNGVRAVAVASGVALVLALGSLIASVSPNYALGVGGCDVNS